MTLANRLRAALSKPAPTNLLAGDLIEGEAGSTVAAAVLVAITRRGGGPVG